MIFLKYIFLILIFIGCTSIGYYYAMKFKKRVIELKELKSSLNIMKSKIQFTYKPLGEIFEELSKIAKICISDMFREASLNVKTLNAKDAWNLAVEDTKNLSSFNIEDINLIKSVGNMLGKTDIKGQVSNLEVSIDFIDTQIQKAEEECKKSEKMYKSLGSIAGLAIVIILF